MQVLTTASHLLDKVTSPNIHNDVFQIAELSRNIQRVREGYQDGGICERAAGYSNRNKESDCYAPFLLGLTSATLSIQDLNFAWACLSWVNELVR
jgi:hypothetical protein